MDLTKILKDAPRGLKLYSTIHGEVEFELIDDKEDYPIITSKSMNPYTLSFNVQSFTKEGRYYLYENGECVLFPSKNQRNWSKFTAPWYKVKKFDPKTLQPFDKVLVRDDHREEWRCDIFSHIDNNVKSCPYFTISTRYKCCIPYNEDTKHLIGTTEEAPEYYKYWKD